MGHGTYIPDKVKKEEIKAPDKDWTRDDCKNMRIEIHGGQIKSIGKAKIIADCLDKIEAEMGVGQTSLVMSGVFICPDTDFSSLDDTAMEVFLQKHIKRMQ